MLGDPVANARYEAVAATLGTMAQVLADFKDELEWALHTVALAETVLPITNPTAFRDKQQNLRDQVELFRPLLKAAQELAPVIDRHRTARSIG